MQPALVFSFALPRVDGRARYCDGNGGVVLSRGAVYGSVGSLERVQPSDLGETAKIGVGTRDREAVLNGESGEMSVGHEIGAVDMWNEAREGGHVPVSRVGNPSAVGRQPFGDLRPGVLDRFGFREYSPVRDDPQESDERRPGEADAEAVIEFVVQPRERLRVLGECVDVRMDQQVHVDEDQAKSSPSAYASTPATSSTSGSVQRPSDTDRV